MKSRAGHYDRTQTRRALLGVAILFFGIMAPLMLAHKAQAATLTQVLVRFDRMVINTQTTGTVCAKPTTASTEADVRVTFPTNYVLGTAANFTVNTTNLAWPATATAWLGINTATNVTGQVVTFPSTDLVVGTLYCFNWVNTAAVKTPTSASGSDLTGTVETRTSGPAQIDIATYATAALAASPGDQITVSASVSQTFNFQISANTDALGTLSTGSIITSPTPRTARVDTNAKNGWLVWGQDTNAGLNSALASKTIASNCTAGAGSNTTLSAGSEGYNLGVTSSQTSGTGTITIATIFVGGTLGRGGGLCSTNTQTIATSSGTANNALLTLNNNATISGTTPAATDYTDLETYVAAGLF